MAGAHTCILQHFVCTWDLLYDNDVYYSEKVAQKEENTAYNWGIKGGKSIKCNTSIVGTNCQHNWQNLYKTLALYRIVRFQWISGNNFVKLKLQMQQMEFKVLIHVRI